jgi:hypothetical protein
MNFTAINATRLREQRNSEHQRRSDVTREANDIQQQTGCTRTEALRVAETLIPRN